MVPGRESREGAVPGLPAPLSALSSPGCAGSEPFRPSRAGWLFLGVFLWLLGTAFPRCGGVRTRSWLQPGRKEASGASGLGSLVAPGPVELFPKADLQAWGLCSVCFSLFVSQALHKSLKELPWCGEEGRQFSHGFSFSPPCSITHPNTCAPVSVPAVTILVLEHESPFFTSCCHVRLKQFSLKLEPWLFTEVVGDVLPANCCPSGGRTAKLQQQQLSCC